MNTYQVGNGIREILATGGESAYAHKRAAVSSKYIWLSELDSEEKIIFGCSEGSHIEEYIANIIVPLGEIRKGRFLGAVQDFTVF